VICGLILIVMFAAALRLMHDIGWDDGSTTVLATNANVRRPAVTASNHAVPGDWHEMEIKRRQRGHG
jgi:hypothetical protein